MTKRWLAPVLMSIASFTAGCSEEQTPAPQAAATPTVAAADTTDPGTPLPCCEPPTAASAILAAATTQPASAAAPTPESPAAPAAGSAASPASTASGGTLPGARVSDWLAPDARTRYDLDFRVTDQDGQVMKLADLAGVPMLVSFLFTECSNPQMCPLIATTMAHLQEDLDKAGLGEKVRLVLITYDLNDTPAKLKKYAETRGLRFTNASLLRPHPDDFRGLMSEFQVGLSYTSTGAINHTIEALLIDAQGRFVRDYQGDVWDNAAVLEDLRRLAGERGGMTNDETRNPNQSPMTKSE